MFERHPADAGLRARFALLAAEDARAAPPFAVPRVARRRRVVPRPRAVAAAAALLAGAGYAWWATRPRATPYPIDLATVTWTGPTDFLLNTPGLALLRDVPIFTAGTGAEHGLAPAPTDDTVRRTPS